jgi:ABC-type phosphate transport system permease subunit
MNSAQQTVWLVVCAVMISTTLVVFIAQYRRRYGRKRDDD